MTTHTMLDGRVQLYLRPATRFWYCAARVDGQRFRTSTGEENLSRAMAFAEEWYLDLRGKLRSGVPLGAPDKPKKPDRSFADAAADYLREIRVLAANTRSPAYVTDLELRLNASILPFFGKMAPAKDQSLHHPELCGQTD